MREIAGTASQRDAIDGQAARPLRSRPIPLSYHKQCGVSMVGPDPLARLAHVTTALSPVATQDIGTRSGLKAGRPASQPGKDGRTMGDVVNLNQYRKQRARAAAQKRASENRVRFGRSKDEKFRQGSDAERGLREFDGKQLDKPTSPEDAPKAR